MKPITAAFLLLAGLAAAQKPSAYIPSVLKPASPRAKLAVASMHADPGFEVELFAAEPDVANVVCIWVDDMGRVFAAETYRQGENGVPDNRDRPGWVLDDLRSETVEDRLSMYLKHDPDIAERYRREHDRIRLLEDTSGDGRADRVLTYADGFNGVLDGTGAGLLSRGGCVYYTCIPHLWMLGDDDGDGIADRREILSTGYGVRVTLRGHDSHGLILGPDGRLYFSIGDRGLSVATREGRRLHLPHTGAVLRCELDGSALEVFATGLRNPQELAFDDFGNLFTCDNNSDSEDRARIVYVVEGGETGWRMNFQYRADRGGWVSEGWWKARHEGQAAFLIPPVAYLGSGPSGLAHYPGTGLPSRYERTFFLCDFLGTRSNSGVRAFRLEPDGAGFRLGESWKFLWNILATDVAFRPDGSMLVSDWVQGWVGDGLGALYAVSPADSEARRRGAQTASILEAGAFHERSDGELVEWLGHGDRRVRLEAQFALAARSFDPLIEAAQSDPRLPARLHGLWGAGQRARLSKDSAPLSALIPLLADGEEEVRAQSARVLGEGRVAEAREGLIARFGDPSLRVRSFAARALGGIATAQDIDPLLALVKDNGDRDVYVRHGAIMALAESQSAADLLARAEGAPASVRLALILALRRQAHPGLARFLDDPDPLLAAEAARALYDLPVEGGYGALAARLGATDRGAPFLRRAVASAEQLGRPEDIDPVWALARNPEVDPHLRHEALEVLLDWGTERPVDRILNMVRPRPAGSMDDVASAIRQGLADAFGSADDRGKLLLARLAARTGIRASGELLAAMRDGECSGATRVAALYAIAATEPERIESTLEEAFGSGCAPLRAAAAGLLVESDPERAVPVLVRAIESGGVCEGQEAFLALGRIGLPEADTVLKHWMRRLLLDNLDPSLRLELIEGVQTRLGRGPEPELQELLDAHDGIWIAGKLPRYASLCQSGGDADRGRKVFFEKTETACTRCHALGDEPARDAAILAGPALDGVASRRCRTSLLQSIVNPNAMVTAGYAEELIGLKDGDHYRGRLIKETPGEVTLHSMIDGEACLVAIPKSLIEYRHPEKSAMPEDLAEKLSLRELRDLVEFLGTLR